MALVLQDLVREFIKHSSTPRHTVIKNKRHSREERRSSVQVLIDRTLGAIAVPMVTQEGRTGRVGKEDSA